MTQTREDRFLMMLEDHKKILFKVANMYGRTPEDRADLVQEMVLQTWRSFDRYDDARKFSTWLYRVALNVAISFYRGERRRSRTIVQADESIFELAVAALESGELEGQLRRLQTLIDQLDELDRALLILYLDGNRYDMIAEILGISETNVGTKISRIKQRLQRDWADHQTKEQTWNSKI